MKIIIFGLGSMGKRRARCLQTLGGHTLFGYDLRNDRIQDARELNVTASNDISSLPLKEADAYFICTPPDRHVPYLELGLEYHKPCFVEASVILDKLDVINKEAKSRNLFIAPSCTLKYHPAIKLIKNIIDTRKYGKVTNFSYHCGQYLPDWHPWESVKDFYVSNPPTGGCREIVPFELTWMVDCFGMPTTVAGCLGKTMDVGADIDDTYAISMKFKEHLGVMLVDVTSRYGIRQLLLNFENAQLHWRWDRNYIEIFDVNHKQWEKVEFNTALSAQGYNQNISEEMYINEVASFLAGIHAPNSYPNNLDEDMGILTLLNTLEKR